MEEIFKRRSIRKFRPGPVSEEQVRSLLGAAMAAPSAMNRRPCHFTVIRDRSIIDRIAEIHPYAAMASRAPLAIVVCADTSVQDVPGYYAQDCSAATQNILLMATHLGLGSVWCGIHPREERAKGFSELLKMPEGIVPFSLIVIGHPDEKKPPNDRYEEEKVHLDSW